MSVAFDAVATANPGPGTTPTSWTHTPVGTPTAVGVWIFNYEGLSNPVLSVSYGGTAMSLFSTLTQPDSSNTVQIWGLANPPSGAKTVAITNGTGTPGQVYQIAASITVTGSDTTTCFRAGSSSTASVSGATNTISVTATATAGDLLVDICGNFNNNSAVSPNAGQTSPWGPLTAGTDSALGSYKAVVGSSTTVGYSGTAVGGNFTSMNTAAFQAAGGGPTPQALNAFLKSTYRSSGAITGKAAMLSKATAQAKASAAPSGKVPLAGTAKTMLASRAPVLAIFALAARATARAAARSTAAYRAALLGNTTSSAKSFAASKGVTHLAGRATTAAKAFAAISTVSSLQAISGVLKAATTARAAMTAVVPVQAVLGRVGAAVKARAGMSPVAGLVSNLKTAASSRGTVAGRAAMAAAGKAASASFASAAGKVGLSARSVSAAAARGVSTAFILLVGAIRSQAKARATGATLRLALTASVKVAATARTQFSRVWLFAHTATATKARGAVSAAFFNLTPVAERTLTISRNITLQVQQRVRTLLARW